MKRKREKKANSVNATSESSIADQNSDAASKDQRTNHEEQPMLSDHDPRFDQAELNSAIMVC